MVRLTLFLASVPLLLTAMQEPSAPQQAGYAAYLLGEYEQAMRQYQAALATSSDPGRLALDLGAIAATAGRFGEASLWFSRSLEDAVGARRARAAYGQATALVYLGVSQPGRRGVVLLQQSLAQFALALREAQALAESERPVNLIADIQHNQAAAETLLVQKQQEPEPPDAELEKESAPVDQQPALKGTSNQRTGNRALPLTTTSEPGSRTADGSSETAAGRGNLPPLPDDEATPPLSREQAARRLEQLRLRLKQPLHTGPLRPGSKDW